MNHITYRISLDLRKTDSGVVVKVKRDDTVKKLAISLTDGGKPYHITEDCSAVFAGEKPDGTILCNDCVIEDCVVTYEITPQTIADLGEVESEIRLYSTNGDLVTSPSFTILVVPPVYDDDRVIESHDEVNALTELITSATSTIQKGEEIVQEANELFDSMPTTYVSFDPQNPTAEEAAQARENIGAASQEDVNSFRSRLADGALSLIDYKTDEKHKLYTNNGNLMMASGEQAVTFLTNEDKQRILEEANDGKVLYTQQNLTDNQKASARQNIGAASHEVAAFLLSRVGTYKILLPDKKTDETHELSVSEGKLEMDGATFLTEEDEHRIAEAAKDGAVLYTQQNLTEEQKAQARDNIGAANADDILKSKVYEHIATITVAPDADGSLPQHVIFTADSEGNSFELTDFFIRAHAGFVSGAQSTLYIDVNKDPAIANGVIGSISTICRYFNIFFRQEAGGMMRAEHTSSTPSDMYYNAQGTIDCSRLIPPMHPYCKPPITKIDLYTLLPAGGEKAWVEGSTFELWGVRV